MTREEAIDALLAGDEEGITDALLALGVTAKEIEATYERWQRHAAEATARDLIEHPERYLRHFLELRYREAVRKVPMPDPYDMPAVTAYNDLLGPIDRLQGATFDELREMARPYVDDPEFDPAWRA